MWRQRREVVTAKVAAERQAVTNARNVPTAKAERWLFAVKIKANSAETVLRFGDGAILFIVTQSPI